MGETDLYDEDEIAEARETYQALIRDLYVQACRMEDDGSRSVQDRLEELTLITLEDFVDDYLAKSEYDRAQIRNAVTQKSGPSLDQADDFDPENYDDRRFGDRAV